MYRYTEFDRQIVRERVAQFRDQTRRYLAGELSEDDFRPLRLQNGLYVQRHAPMLRIAIPYGTLSAVQLRALAAISREFDRGWGHFTTRQNLQLNWVRLEEVPDILARLADVDMHAIQTSGNCIRNTTTDHFAGVAADEVLRQLCTLLREDDPAALEYLQHNVVVLEAMLGTRLQRVYDRVQAFEFDQALEAIDAAAPPS